MQMKNVSWIFVLALILMAGCAGGQKEMDVVTIKTTYGDMTAVLYDQTPKHKANFLKLVDEKFYDSTLFHRIMEGFMIQGGDPNSKNAQPGEPLGRGGPGYTVPAEINAELYHEKGALSAARLGDQMNPQKESSGSQFYIVQGMVIPEEEQKVDQQKLQRGLQQMYGTGRYKPFFDSLEVIYSSGDQKAYMAAVMKQVPRIEKVTGSPIRVEVPADKLKKYSTIGGVPFLDGQYTVFGKVIKGLDVLDKIAAVQVGPDPNSGEMSLPQEPVRITVTHSKMKVSEIEKACDCEIPAVK
jgi:cyclophilin family peptidyl-prolyl cis-trans isomerase